MENKEKALKEIREFCDLMVSNYTPMAAGFINDGIDAFVLRLNDAADRVKYIQEVALPKINARQEEILKLYEIDFEQIAEEVSDLVHHALSSILPFEVAVEE